MDETVKCQHIETGPEIGERKDFGLIHMEHDVHDESLVIFGGVGYGGNFNGVNILNIKSLDWRFIIIKNMPKMSSFSCDLYNGNILIFGGTINNDWSNKLYLLNINKQEINEIKVNRNNINIPPRLYHESCILNDKLYIFGGRNHDNDNKLYIIDLNSNYNLSYINTSLDCLHRFSMLTFNDTVLIIGGHGTGKNNNQTITNALLCYVDIESIIYGYIKREMYIPNDIYNIIKMYTGLIYKTIPLKEQRFDHASVITYTNNIPYLVVYSGYTVIDNQAKYCLNEFEIISLKSYI